MEANTPKTREREESDDVVTGQKKRLKIARLSQKINHNCSTSFTARSNAITGTSEHATSGSGIKAARDSSSLEVQLSFDGGSRGNPGISGAGSEIIVLEKIATKIQQQQNQLQERQQEQQQEFNNISRKKIKIRKFVGFNATNNIAEYQGLICGLQKASEIVSEFIRSGHQHPPSPSLLQPLSSSSLQHPHDHKQKEDAIAALNESIKVFVRGDSDLIIQQMKGEYKCKSALLKPLYKDAKDIIEKMKREIIESNKAQNKRQRQLDVVFDHIYRNQNSVADCKLVAYVYV